MGCLQDTAQKMKFSNKDFFSTCDQIHKNPRIWSHLLKKSLMENLIFCAVGFVKDVFVLATDFSCGERFVGCHSTEMIGIIEFCVQGTGLTKLTDACIANKLISLNRMIIKEKPVIASSKQYKISYCNKCRNLLIC